MPRRTLALIVAVIAALGSASGTAAAAPRTVGDDPVIASFEGGTINLHEGWGSARACTSDGTNTRCYRSETAMNQAEKAGSTMVIPFADCSSSVRLYNSGSFGGSVLQLTARGIHLNLSGYGFDNATSSYKIGACNATFYDGAGGGAPVYPGSTGAGATATAMASGWDNRVSSVYIA